MNWVYVDFDIVFFHSNFPMWIQIRSISSLFYIHVYTKEPSIKQSKKTGIFLVMSHTSDTRDLLTAELEINVSLLM